MHYKNISLLDELASIVHVLDQLPEFVFSEEEKKEVLNEEVLKAFDGSFEYLVDFHSQLKDAFFHYQTAKAEYFSMFPKILNAYQAASGTAGVDFGLTEVHVESDLGRVTMSQYLNSTNHAVNSIHFGRLAGAVNHLIDRFWTKHLRTPMTIVFGFSCLSFSCFIIILEVINIFFRDAVSNIFRSLFSQLDRGFFLPVRSKVHSYTSAFLCRRGSLLFSFPGASVLKVRNSTQQRHEFGVYFEHVLPLRFLQFSDVLRHVQPVFGR